MAWSGCFSHSVKNTALFHNSPLKTIKQPFNRIHLIPHNVVYATLCIIINTVLLFSSVGADLCRMSWTLCRTCQAAVMHPKIFIDKMPWCIYTFHMSTEAQRKAKAKYQKAKTKNFSLQFNLVTDADILQYLESLENKQGYIKELIRKDIKKQSWNNIV